MFTKKDTFNRLTIADCQDDIVAWDDFFADDALIRDPAGFVEIEKKHHVYDYRLSTAKGVVIGVREIDNEAEGGAEFWLTAVQDQMREQGGYALLETLQVKSADGVPGTQLRFGHDDGNNTPHLYYLTLFVTEPTIWLVEAGGTKELMTKEQAKIDQAIATFRTN